MLILNKYSLEGIILKESNEVIVIFKRNNSKEKNNNRNQPNSMNENKKENNLKFDNDITIIFSTKQKVSFKSIYFLLNYFILLFL